MPKKPTDEHDPATVLQKIEDGYAAVLNRALTTARDRVDKESRPAGKAAREALDRLTSDNT
ncbi:hypothetical protein ACQPYK_29350 [Streptosporangium sp. CA-135522]|uniref:hypothetical protein n=1 Tax=Streptosporangium sp. CA-135522 TaxID=3240072 RepID=UPI003D8D6DBE